MTLTGPCLAGGPIAKLVACNIVQIVIDRNELEGSIDSVGHAGQMFGLEEGSRILANRPLRAGFLPHPSIPEATRLWAALQMP